MTEKIIQQGAEANIILIRAKGREPFIIKDRIKKNYRLSEIDDEIRSRRTRSEAKLLEKASQVINSPKPFFEPCIKNSSKLKMPFIEGKKLSDHLDSFPLKEEKKICRIIGENTAKLHDTDIIHGDLTTSNMIYVKNNRESNENINGKRGDRKGFKVFFIDFGLGFGSHKIEDKAVDLHLLRQALEAKHFKHWKELFNEVSKGYSISKNHKLVLKQLEKVEKRGRYKGNY